MQKISNSDSNENSTARKELSSVSKTPPPVISIVSKKKLVKQPYRKADTGDEDKRI